MFRYTLLSTNISNTKVDIIFTIHKTKLNVKEKRIRFIAFKGNQNNPLCQSFSEGFLLCLIYSTFYRM